jgi:hypothetical protein
VIAQKGNFQAIQIYILATLLLTGVALGFYFGGLPDRYPDEIRGLILDPADAGTDLTIFDRFKERVNGALVLIGDGIDEQFNYGPLSAVVITFFLRAFPDPVLALTVFGAAGALIAAFFVCLRVRSNVWAVLALVLAAATSYPFVFLFDRGNIEGVVWIPTAAGVFCFVRGRYLASALLLAVAASLKPYPGLFLLLLLPIRKFRDFGVALAATAAISTASLAFIGPNVFSAMRQLILGFQLAQVRYVTRYRPWEIFNDHSVFALFKQLLRLARGWPAPGTLNGPLVHAYPYYIVLALAILLASLYRLRELPTLNQIFGISALIVLLPPYNADYTLVMIYIPWAMLLSALSVGPILLHSSAAKVLMACCAVIFTTQFYLLFGYDAEMTGIGGQIKAVATIIILAISVTCPLPVDTSPIAQI